MSDQRGYEGLTAWKKGIVLAETVYRLAAQLPKEERYELSSQLRKAVVSISANIAEGSARNTSREFLHFLGIAQGSLAEVDTLLVISSRVGLLPGPETAKTRELVSEERRILFGLIEGIEGRIESRRKPDRPDRDAG